MYVRNRVHENELGTKKLFILFLGLSSGIEFVRKLLLGEKELSDK